MINDKVMQEISIHVHTILNEIINAAGLSSGQILVVGASSSEILGKHIGKATSLDVGKIVIEAALAATKDAGVFLAVQCCEHLNRALVVEMACAEAFRLDLVSARPISDAGGACAAAAYEAMERPVLAEHIAAHAGVDFGDTNIGMHVKFVQVPFRPTINRVGEAHVTALTSRPKLIGGVRTKYE